MLKYSIIQPIGLAETYKSQPYNPVDFLAKWLLNYCNSAVEEDRTGDRAKDVDDKREVYLKHIKEQESISANKAIEDKKNETKIQQFVNKFHQSDDLEDHLQELSDFLQVIPYVIST
jgi:Dpy-30 motif